MRANLTTRDYELLSAYIDGQLAPGEQRKLEERLHARPELQVALEELRRTRMLLRQAPRRRAPRNFTLTPAMVGEQRRKPAPWAGWFPALSFTSALAALALVVTIVLQFAPPGTTAQTVAMQPPAADMQEAPAMKNAEKPAAPEAAAAQPAASQPAESAGAAPASSAPEGARGMAAQPTATPGPAVLPAYEATAQAFGEATLTPSESGAGGETPAAEVMAAPADNLTATAPPVIQWNNANPSDPAYAKGMGGAGGMGGGGGEGPSLGPLMGPPPAPADASSGATGLGGGAPDGSLTLPPGSVAPEGQSKQADATPAAQATPAPDSAASPSATESAAVTDPAAAPEAANATSTPDPGSAAGTPIAAVPAASAANNSGPILGVPGAGEGGQIVEKKAILGDGNSARSAVGEAGQPLPGGAAQPAPANNQPNRLPFGLNSWALTAIQVTLALLAIAAGVAAYLFRLHRSR